ncbi:hypothetical protein V8C43DRAFT_28896 [Trichoderma afarasin]
MSVPLQVEQRKFSFFYLHAQKNQQQQPTPKQAIGRFSPRFFLLHVDASSPSNPIFLALLCSLITTPWGKASDFLKCFINRTTPYTLKKVRVQ